MSTQPRSGYARLSKPELLSEDEKAGLTVPIADASGVQDGVIPIKDRNYTNMNIEAVSIEEAERRAHLRSQGKLKPIGSDVTTATKPTKGSNKVTTKVRKPANAESDSSSPRKHANFDPLGEESIEPGSPELEAEERRLAQLGRGSVVSEAVGTTLCPPKAEVTMDRLDTYLQLCRRVSLELHDGTMFISVIEVQETPCSITLILPISADSGTFFIPKAGTELTIYDNGKSWHCFFPGTFFTIDKLGIMGLVFVKAD